MKRILILVTMLLFSVLSACGDDGSEGDVEGREANKEETTQEPETNAKPANDKVNEEAGFTIDVLFEESEQESNEKLFLFSLNNLLLEFDKEYEDFEIAAGISLFEEYWSEGTDTAMEYIEIIPEESLRQIYGKFLDELIEIEALIYYK